MNIALYPDAATGDGARRAFLGCEPPFLVPEVLLGSSPVPVPLQHLLARDLLLGGIGQGEQVVEEEVALLAGPMGDHQYDSELAVVAPGAGPVGEFVGTGVTRSGKRPEVGITQGGALLSSAASSSVRFLSEETVRSSSPNRCVDRAGFWGLDSRSVNQPVQPHPMEQLPKQKRAAVGADTLPAGLEVDGADVGGRAMWALSPSSIVPTTSS